MNYYAEANMVTRRLDIVYSDSEVIEVESHNGKLFFWGVTITDYAFICHKQLLSKARFTS